MLQCCVSINPRGESNAASVTDKAWSWISTVWIIENNLHNGIYRKMSTAHFPLLRLVVCCYFRRVVYVYTSRYRSWWRNAWWFCTSGSLRGKRNIRELKRLLDFRGKILCSGSFRTSKGKPHVNERGVTYKDFGHVNDAAVFWWTGVAPHEDKSRNG